MEEENQIQIPRVKLGSQGLEVSKLAYGCAGLSGYYGGPLPYEEGCLMIKEVFSRGITFFDTADVYGENHHNEILVGKALKNLPREKVQLATKFGISDRDGQVIINGSPEYVRKCCEASLKRLKVDYIDLYYQHRIDVSVPVEDTMEELKKLVEDGKIKYIGLSEASTDTIRRAHAVHPITAIQMEYSLLTREIETDIIPLCRKLGIGIVAYSPLGHGFFAGKAMAENVPSESLLREAVGKESVFVSKTVAGRGGKYSHLGGECLGISSAIVGFSRLSDFNCNFIPRFNGENLERNKLHYSRVAELASRHACTPSQLALAWLLHQGDDIVPLPGTTKVKNLDNNIRSLAVKLTEEDLKTISEAVPADEVVGEREVPILYKYSWKFATTPPKNRNPSAT